MPNRTVIRDFDRPAIIEALHTLAADESVVVIKGGARMLDQDNWIRFIDEVVGLQPDRRHFDPNWAAHDAVKNAQQHGVVSTAASTADESSTEEQIRSADWWEISYQPDREIAYAYSKTAQPLHTDNAWFADPAEINFFIMAKQAKSGGQQTIYPLSRLIDDLGADNPSLLDDLTSVPVVIRKGENDFANRTTIIVQGDRPRVYWNYYRTVKDNPDVAALCDRFFEYLKGKTDTSSVERVQLETGDCLSFNDLHMLHGRTAYEAEQPRDRVLLHSMWKLPNSRKRDSYPPI